MSSFTDSDIPICCGECFPGTYFEGMEAMTQHILDVHKHYDALEAAIYAEMWMESAYERELEEMMTRRTE